MAISLKSLSSGSGIEIGECVYLPSSNSTLVVLDNMTFLKSGFVITDPAATYPEATATFSYVYSTNPTVLAIGLSTAVTDSNGTLYMRIK